MATMVTPKYQIAFETSKYWNLRIDEFEDLQDYIMRATFITAIQLLFETPADYIVSAKIYPVNIMALADSTRYQGTIKVGSVNTNVHNANYYKNNLIKCGIIASYTFTESFNSFLDYEPYTKVQVYLPYYDFVDIDINTYMGKRLNIGLNIDLSTGLGVYYFEVNGNIYETYNAKFGVDIPLSNGNANEIARNLLLTGLNTTKQFINMSADYQYKSGLKSTSKNIDIYEGINASQVGIGSVVDFINANQKKFNKSSQPSGYLDFTKPQSVFLIISRPVIAKPTNYGNTIGYPCGKYLKLADLTGLTIVDEVHLEEFGIATETEKSEVETLLKSGVIL